MGHDFGTTDSRRRDELRVKVDELLCQFKNRQLPVSTKMAVGLARKDGYWDGHSDREIADLVTLAASSKGRCVKMDSDSN